VRSTNGGLMGVRRVTTDPSLREAVPASSSARKVRVVRWLSLVGLREMPWMTLHPPWSPNSIDWTCLMVSRSTSLVGATQSLRAVPCANLFLASSVSGADR
jgi:hypothetical protein